MITRYRSEVSQQSATRQYVEEIDEAWNASIKAILRVGRLLIKAKDELPHGDFRGMIDEHLPFGPRTAQKLMEIARHSIIGNATHESQLPRCWTTLERLAHFPEERLEQLLNSGRIGAETSRREADAILGEIRVEGVFDPLRLHESICQLIRFRREHPEPGGLARRLADNEENLLEPEEFEELCSWLQNLGRHYRVALELQDYR